MPDIHISEAADKIKKLEAGEYTLKIYGESSNGTKLSEMQEALENLSEDVIINLDLSNLNDDYGFTPPRNIKSLILPDTQETLYTDIFYYASSLESITIPASITELEYDKYSRDYPIDDDFLYHCPSLDCPDKMPDCYSPDTFGIFSHCINLKEIIVDKDSEYFCVEDGVLYNKDKTELISCIPTKAGIFHVPDTVEKIQPNAFANCNSLTKIQIPESVEIIGTEAFFRCASLNEIIFSEGLKEIGYRCFSGCSSLSSICIPKSVTNFGNECEEDDVSCYPTEFYACKSLKSVEIKAIIETISAMLFQGCSDITNIKLPDSISEIEYEAFEDCTGLSSINLPDNLQVLEEMCFYNCSSLESITLPKSLKEIEQGVFDDCQSLKEIIFDGTVEELKSISVSTDDYSFSGVPAKVITCKDGEVEIEHEEDI